MQQTSAHNINKQTFFREKNCLVEFFFWHDLHHLHASNGLHQHSSKLLWTPMDSNGLQWAPMVRATQLKICSLKSPPPMTSYGLLWSAPLSSRHAISNLHLQWPPMAPMVRATQLTSCSLKSPPPMASNRLQWSRH